MNEWKYNLNSVYGRTTSLLTFFFFYQKLKTHSSLPIQPKLFSTTSQEQWTTKTDLNRTKWCLQFQSWQLTVKMLLLTWISKYQYLGLSMPCTLLYHKLVSCTRSQWVSNSASLWPFKSIPHAQVGATKTVRSLRRLAHDATKLNDLLHSLFIETSASLYSIYIHRSNATLLSLVPAWQG